MRDDLRHAIGIFHRLAVRCVLQEHHSGHIGHFGYRERPEQADMTTRAVRDNLNADARYIGLLKRNSAIFARAGSYSLPVGQGERNTNACTPA
jgi:hypothetical protein